MRTRVARSTEQLIVRNAENLRWALFRGFDETFRNAAGHIEERLDDAINAMRRVIKKALTDRRDRSFAANPCKDSPGGYLSPPLSAGSFLKTAGAHAKGDFTLEQFRGVGIVHNLEGMECPQNRPEADDSYR